MTGSWMQWRRFHWKRWNHNCKFCFNAICLLFQNAENSMYVYISYYLDSLNFIYKITKHPGSSNIGKGNWKWLRRRHSRYLQASCLVCTVTISCKEPISLAMVASSTPLHTVFLGTYPLFTLKQIDTLLQYVQVIV